MVRRTHTLVLRSVFLFLLLFGSQAHAQPAAPDSVALAFAQALTRHDFLAAAALTHPADLSALQADLATVADAALDAEMAVWTTGAESGQAVRAVVPSIAFAQYMGRLLEVIPQLGDALAVYNPRLIGAVVGADTAHVVLDVQKTELSTTLGDADVVRVVRSRKGWRALLPARLRALSAGLARRAEE